MGNNISFINIIIGIISLATNLLIINLFGLDLYGKFALILLCQSIGSILFDLGYSNIIVQQRSIASLELKKIELFSNTAVITVVIAGFMVLTEPTTTLNPVILIFWCVCSVRSSRNIALLQRAKKIKQIIFGDGLQVISFLILISIGAITAPVLDIEILSYLLISQLLCLAIRMIYTQINVKSPDISGDFSMYQTRGLALSQVIDRSTRVIVSKGEQLVFTLLFNGAELGLFLFLSNVSVQFLSRLSSPQTRYIVAMSKEIQESQLSCTLKYYYRRYLTTICLVSIFSGIIIFFGSQFIEQLEQVYSLLLDNYDIVLLIAIISFLRIDIDFYLAWLVCIRKYYFIPGFNLIVGIMIILLVVVFVNLGIFYGLTFGFILSFGFIFFERFIKFPICFWYKKTILISLLMLVPLYWLLS